MAITKILGAAARDEGLTRFTGITAHGAHAPGVTAEALSRFDYDMLMVPVNDVQYGRPEYRHVAEGVIRECQARNMRVLVIKTATADV